MIDKNSPETTLHFTPPGRRIRLVQLLVVPSHNRVGAALAADITALDGFQRGENRRTMLRGKMTLIWRPSSTAP